MNGYKHTELGWIPEDWAVYPLEELGSFSKGKGILKEEVTSSGIPCIRYGEIYTTHHYFVKKIASFIPESVAKESQRIEKGVVLFAGSGETVEEIGKAVAYDKDEIAYAGGDIIILKVNKKANPLYLAYVLNTDTANFQKRRLGAGHSVVHLYPKDIARIKVTLPDIKEQIKIAGIFKTWNKAIELISSLIKAKQAYKSWLIEKISARYGEWDFEPLGDVADRTIKWSFTGGPFGSNLKSSEYTPNGVRIIQLQNIGDGEFLNEYKIYTSEGKANDLLSCNIYPGEIIISKMGDPVARAAIIPGLERRYVMASDGIRLVPDSKKFDTKFLLEVINSPWFRKQAESHSTGSTRKRIGLDELRKLKVPRPDLNEQKEIGAIFRAIDSEILALRRQLELYEEQKRGLMQQLLTGRKRVQK